MAENFSKLPINLQSLYFDLSGNNIGEGIELIGKHFEKLPRNLKLLYLQLGENFILPHQCQRFGQNFRQLPQSLSTFTVNLDCNNIQNEGAKALA